MRLLARHKSAHLFALTLKENWLLCGMDLVWQNVLNGTALSLSNLHVVIYLKLSSKVTQICIKYVISHREIDNDLFTFSVHVPGLYVHNSLVNVILPIKI